jgi:molybdate transport system substrate-binding protein
MSTLRRFRVAAAIIATCLATARGTDAQAPGEVTAFAAASLTSALQEVVNLHTQKGGATVRLSFAASSTLARQIEAGARAQVFVSADEAWMNHLEGRGMIEPATRRRLLGNRLVLVVPADRPLALDLTKHDWLTRLPAGRIATGDPAHVPVGRYAQAALTKSGVWQAVESRLARADNVQSALVLVERGEAAAGMVYATDAAGSRRVAVAGTFAADLHPPIVYPAALIKGGDSPQARAFLAFLGEPAALDIFRRHGFTVP